jgi:hypothetical protein
MADETTTGLTRTTATPAKKRRRNPIVNTGSSSLGSTWTPSPALLALGKKALNQANRRSLLVATNDPPLVNPFIQEEHQGDVTEDEVEDIEEVDDPHPQAQNAANAIAQGKFI